MTLAPMSSLEGVQSIVVNARINIICHTLWTSERLNDSKNKSNRWRCFSSLWNAKNFVWFQFYFFVSCNQTIFFFEIFHDNCWKFRKDCEGIFRLKMEKIVKNVFAKIRDKENWHIFTFLCSSTRNEAKTFTNKRQKEWRIKISKIFNDPCFFWDGYKFLER